MEQLPEQLLLHFRNCMSFWGPIIPPKTDLSDTLTAQGLKDTLKSFLLPDPEGQGLEACWEPRPQRSQL